MRHYILYYHGGSGNHGCEAIVRTTAELLEYKKNKLSLASFRPDEDKEYKIDRFCDIHEMYEKKSCKKKSYLWAKTFLKSKITCNDYIMKDLPLLNAVGARKGDIALSIGGDNYCYNDCDNIRKANDIFRRNGIKTVLWGCSIEPEILLDSRVAEDISQFDLVTARESITYEAIKQVNHNTMLVSDSAFNLQINNVDLPAGVKEKRVVGINISPLAESFEISQGIIKRSIQKLIEYVIFDTDMSVLLIPHVVWSHDDDRVMNRLLYGKYKDTGKVFLIDDNNSQNLKGYISKCRYFIGARTHATIAAYSCNIPTLVLGYSTKSKGIARDLFGQEKNYVLPIQNIKTDLDLVSSFNWLQKNEQEIINRLSYRIPIYKKSILTGLEALKSL